MNPFTAEGDSRPHLVRVIFLAAEPAAVLVTAVSADARQYVCVDYVDGVHGNPRTASFFERTPRERGTERNWRSMLTLYKMTLAGETCS